MRGYLLDTCICVFLFRDKYGVAERLNAVDPNDIYISEVTVAELKYGAANSSDPEELIRTQEFVDSVNVIPFRSSIDLFAAEKVRCIIFLI